MTKRLLTVLTCVTAVTIGSAGVAVAAEVTLSYTGQGTTDDGLCEEIEGEAGEGVVQLWQFNLTGLDGGAPDARMSATFDDGSSYTEIEPTRTPGTQGNTAHFIVATEPGAAVVSAAAFFEEPDQGNPQFTVSHCEFGNGNGNGDDGNGDDGNGDDGNGDDGNGDDGNGDGENGEDEMRPPTDVPAGVVFVPGRSRVGEALASAIALGA